jgi:hypothetical protein
LINPKAYLYLILPTLLVLSCAHCYEPVLEKKCSFGRFGRDGGELNGPSDITAAVSAGGLPRFIVSDAGNRRIAVYNSECRFLHAVAADRLEVPVTAVELPGGDTFAYDKLRRTICRISRLGEIKQEISAACGRNFGNRLKLKRGRFGNMLAVDADNNRLVQLTATGQCTREYVKGQNLFFSCPVDAVPLGEGMVILDKGNHRVIQVNKSGMGKNSCTLQEFSKGLFIIKAESSFLVFTDDCQCGFLDRNLDLTGFLYLDEQFVAGVLVSKNRLLLLSEQKQRIFEYRLSFR